MCIKFPLSTCQRGKLSVISSSSHLMKSPGRKFDKFEPLRENNRSACEADYRHCCQSSLNSSHSLFFLGSKSSLQFKWPACHAQLFNPIYFTQHARKFTRSQCALNKLFMQPCLLQGGVDTVLVYYGSRRASPIRRGACFLRHVFAQSVRFCTFLDGN